MNKKERVEGVLYAFDKEYGGAKCYLNYQNAWQLLFATILSAQCTDDRVNMVTKELFKKYPTLKAFAEADLQQMEQDVHSTGFYRNKAKNIISSARTILEKHNGEVPSDMESLTALAGVGRKTANVIRGHIFNIPSIVVDTHVKRISNILEFTKSQNPEIIEKDLSKLLPKDHWISFNTQAIAHGRKICVARRPKCDECVIQLFCPKHI